MTRCPRCNGYLARDVRGREVQFGCINCGHIPRTAAEIAFEGFLIAEASKGKGRAPRWNGTAM